MNFSKKSVVLNLALWKHTGPNTNYKFTIASINHSSSENLSVSNQQMISQAGLLEIIPPACNSQSRVQRLQGIRRRRFVAGLHSAESTPARAGVTKHHDGGRRDAVPFSAGPSTSVPTLRHQKHPVPSEPITETKVLLSQKPLAWISLC